LPKGDGDKSVSAAKIASEALWRVAHDLRSATSVDEVLSLVAHAIADAGLYRRTVITLHNEQGDITAIGYHGVSKDMIAAARHARRIPLATRQAILDSANKISESYFVPCELGLDLSGEGRCVKCEAPPGPEGQWRPEDELFVPLVNAEGSTIGYASVDTPPDGRRPELPTIHCLELFIHLAAEALGRLQADRSSVAAESRFHRLIAHTNDVVFRANIPENSFEYFNPAIEGLIGYSAKYLMSRPVDSLIGQIIHPEDRNDLLTLWMSHRDGSLPASGGSAAIEFRLRHKDGTIRWVWGKSIGVTDDDGRPVAIEGILRDITSQHELQEKLAESERKYRLVAENTRDLVYACDHEGVFFYISPSAERFLGVAPDEVIGTHLSDWLTDDPVNRAAFEVRRAAVVRGEAVDPFILKLRSKTGQTFLMELNECVVRDEGGTTLGIQGVGRDVTEQKRAEETLRRGEQRFRELADLLPQTVFEIDLDGRLTFANRCAKETFGYAEDDFTRGLNGFALFAEEDQEKIRQNIERMQRGQPPERHVYTAIRKNGETFPASIYSSPIRQGEKLVGFRGIVIDITELRLAEGALRENEKLFRTLSTNIPGMIYRGNPDWTTEILFNSDIISGYAVKEFSTGKMNWLDIVHPDDRERVFRETSKLSAGRTNMSHEYRIIDKGGKIRWIEDHKTSRFTDDGVFWGVDGVAFDVTERKCAEEALRQSEEKFRMMLNSSPDAITVTDLDGKIIECNQAALDLHGCRSKEEVMGRKAIEFIAPHDRPRALENMKKTPEHDSVKDVEYALLARDGSIFPGELSASVIRDSKGKPTSFIAVVKDITERKRVEQVLQESEETARALVNATTETMILLDSKGTVLTANLTAAQRLGQKVDELVGQNMADLAAKILPTSVGKSRITRIKKVIATGEPQRFQDERDGMVFDTSCYPILDREGKVMRLAVFARDITERENMLRQLRRKSKELNRANSYLAEMVSELHRRNRQAHELTGQYQAKNAELESLVFTLSHDLKTPLVSIRELTAIFRRRYSRLIDEQGRHLARRISVNAKNMLRLVESLLDYARAEDCAEGTDDVELGRLVDDIWERVLDAFPGRDAVLQRPPQAVSCCFSRIALERVLANLLHNAVAYVPEDRAPEIEVQWKCADERLNIRVSDNGIGIPTDEKDKIFELFYRAQPTTGEGSGIGLAVVKKIVDAVKGTIDISARPAGGTIFTIDLPLKTRKKQLPT